ncbi:MAG: hypothetical protein IKK75_13365 [Clostridia bacterium]|nr:hypothetical protein [Clostridia bacterium]
MKDFIPAGAGEKMQYMVHPFNDNTIRFLLRYPGLIRADLLKEAVRAIVGSVDVLHASFAAGKLGARWHVHDAMADEFFTCIATEEPVEAGFALALESISPSAPVQLRCTLIRGKDESVVVLLVSHLCADGSDGKYLLNKLCEACRMLLETGNCAALTVKNGNRSVEQVYNHLSKQEMRQLLKDPRTGIKCEFPLPTADAGQPTALWRRISEDTMASARAKAKQAGATVNDLLLTACYYAYAETVELERHTPMSIMSMMDLRRHCDHGDTEGLCNLTGSLPTALPDGLCSTFDETLASIAGQTRRCKNDPYAGLYGMPLLHGAAGKLPLGLLQAAASRLYGSMSLGMTNVGSIDLNALQLDGLTPVEGWFGGPVKRKPGVQVSTASFGGACSLCIWGHASDGDKPMLEQLLDHIAKHVEAYASAGNV